MRKRVVRALIFLAIAIAGVVGATSVAGALGAPTQTQQPDGFIWE